MSTTVFRKYRQVFMANNPTESIVLKFIWRKITAMTFQLLKIKSVKILKLVEQQSIKFHLEDQTPEIKLQLGFIYRI